MTDNYLQPPEDLSNAVETVAAEIDSRRTFLENVRDAMRTSRLFFAITWHHLRGWWR